MFLSLLCSVLSAEIVNYVIGSLEISMLFCLAGLLSKTVRNNWKWYCLKKNPVLFYIVVFLTLTAFQTCKINVSSRVFFSICLPRLLMQGRGVPHNLWSFSESWTGIYAVSVGFSIGDYKQNIILFASFC